MPKDSNTLTNTDGQNNAISFLRLRCLFTLQSICCRF